MKWISVKDRLPNHTDFYLICYYWHTNGERHIKEAFYTDLAWSIYHPDGAVNYSDENPKFIVTHWMLLPSLPKDIK